MILLLIALNTFAQDYEFDYEPTEEEQVIHLDNLYVCHLCGYEVVVLGNDAPNDDSVEFDSLDY